MNTRTGAHLLERGDIFFFYRPAPQAAPAGSLLEVNRFHVVLRPEGKQGLRYITIGKKKLPGEGGDRRNWGFVAGVFREAKDLRQVLVGSDDRDNASEASAVPAGEGVYALARQGRNTVLAYALQLPEHPGAVQQEFDIHPEARLTLVIKNPDVPSLVGVGLNDDRRPEYPEELQERFGGRKWIGADPPDFLDYEGTELLLIAEHGSVPDLDIDLEPEPENEETAKVFQDLGLGPSQQTLEPLFDGDWA